MRYIIVTMMLLASAVAATAQHDHDNHNAVDTAALTHKAMTEHEHGAHTGTTSMSHAFSLNLPMNRNASGTGWLPDESPMYGYMAHSRKWMYMFHGNVFIRYNKQDIYDRGTRGDSKVDALTWFMAMGQRRVGKHGLFHFSTMFSLDPLFGGEGYPLLFQTGETHEGKPLVDRQHPHNLFSEVAVSYAHALNEDVDAFVYFGFPGEPALGPAAFMHRPSSLNNPDSPLGHHWQDATHITFGVATAGIRYKWLKLDGSVFTGREPGEERYGFDKPSFDSYSYRLTTNPSANWAIQVSRAVIKNPEGGSSGEDVKRTTASVIHSASLAGNNRSVNSTAVWGYNDSGVEHREHSYTLESNLQLDRLAIYGRFESVQKSAEELLLEDFDHHEITDIRAVTLGINYTFLRKLKTNLALGAQATLYDADADLDEIYGENPVSGEIYIRISPQLIRSPR